jgi:AMP nucleosidase
VTRSSIAQIEKEVPAHHLVSFAKAAEAVDHIIALYDRNITAIVERFHAFAEGRAVQGGEVATYPYLCVEVRSGHPIRTGLAFGKVSSPGLYGTTVTAPAIFAAYFNEQLDLLVKNQGARIYVGQSTVPIPLTFAIERAVAQLSPERRAVLSDHFPMPNLPATHDDIADGHLINNPEHPKPLALFSAERVDYSLHRLRHYTATDPVHFQDFVLFTNYQRYVDEFVEFGRAQVEAGAYLRFIEPGNRITQTGKEPEQPPLLKMPQMPAYHLVGAHEGITLVNIGIGPSNAKTITDHLAVLRPHVWLMIGHCGGLRGSQRLGDYVLAHAYLRDDNVLDQALPIEIPLPTIAEVQLALSQAVAEVTALKGPELKERLRTGTVVTTHDRNWELRYNALALRFNQSRAIAVDMESATIAANGYRFRVPYGTLLCVSDRPLHGEIKLAGMADAFYEESVSQHLRIAIRAVELLRAEARAGTLHSRKLRSFVEPAFR